jgi:hypothetical protein
MQASARQPRTSRWLAILFFTTGAAAVLPGAGVAQEKGGCQREAISVLMSPDDAWVALVQEDICSDGYFVTTVTDTVQLSPRGATDAVQLTSHSDKPKHENDIFALDEHGHPEMRPLTRWLSPQQLQITVPNKSLIGLQKSSYEGIEVVVKFEPDDPAERERWLKSLGLPTK